ncbi:MAG: SGNH/GDSL hydrolase family protein [Clostridia bacterium]|nr:SGNH/GDSL hydrolase family protein [Clostridia bacterium]
MNILVFGDSITYGYYDLKGGWAKRLYRLYNEDKKGSFKNFSLPGATSKDMIAQIKRAKDLNILDKDNFKVIFAYGINDSATGFMDYISLDAFKENTIKIIELMNNYNLETIFVGLTIMDESIEDGFGGLLFYSNESIGLYNEVLKKTCKQFGIPFVDIYKHCLKEKDKYLSYLDDGIHPNANGHKFILEEVLKVFPQFINKTNQRILVDHIEISKKSEVD